MEHYPVASTTPPIFSTIHLEREIGEEFRKLTPAVRSPDLAMPDYVERRDGVTEIGKLSAEAVIERVKQCEPMTNGAFAVTEEMKETAASYREEVKRVFLEIENCSRLTAEVRETCNELIEKIAGPVTLDRLKPSRWSGKR